MPGLNRIPARLPAGTKYVVEGRRVRGRAKQVFSRYLELPDGTHIELADAVIEPKPRRQRRKRLAH